MMTNDMPPAGSRKRNRTGEKQRLIAGSPTLLTHRLMHAQPGGELLLLLLRAIRTCQVV